MGLGIGRVPFALRFPYCKGIPHLSFCREVLVVLTRFQENCDRKSTMRKGVRKYPIKVWYRRVAGMLSFGMVKRANVPYQRAEKIGQVYSRWIRNVDRVKFPTNNLCI